MPLARPQILSRYRSASRFGLVGLCLLLASCASIFPASEQSSSEVSTPTPADTSAPTSTNTGESKPESSGNTASQPKSAKPKPVDPKPAAPEGVTILDPAGFYQGMQQHHQALQQREDLTLPPGEVGYYLDNLHARLIQKLRSPGITFTRSGDVMTVRIAGGQTFASNSTRLEPEISTGLVPLAEVLAEYNKTRIQIAGHTDDKGPEDYNQKLSEKRAFALADVLIEAGVDTGRIAIIGFGESQPLQPNTSDESRAQNRRLDLQIEPIVPNFGSEPKL